MSEIDWCTECGHVKEIHDLKDDCKEFKSYLRGNKK